MERKEFFKSMGLAGLALAGFKVLNSCSNDDGTETGTGDTSGGDTSGGDTSGGDTTADCIVAPSETEGPFPTINPASLERNDIRSDRTGVPLAIDITINDAGSNCAALEGAIVDIWHCDKDGYYSEYGGTGMQQVNYTSVHFLRGRQITNAEGKVAFTSIFPGWYNGRATHIHVHIYDSAGHSLVVTQIAFPEGTDSAVALVNASSENGYTKGLNGYTYNSQDNIFSDDDEGIEIASVTGSVADGYNLTHTINVIA